MTSRLFNDKRRKMILQQEDFNMSSALSQYVTESKHTLGMIWSMRRTNCPASRLCLKSETRAARHFRQRQQ